MHMYGISGPDRIYGHPFQYGAQIQYTYYPPKTTVYVRIDLFFIAIEGSLLISPLLRYLDSWYRYEYPNTGFELIDFLGEPVLAPVDIHAYLLAGYGPSYMVPLLKQSKCLNCLRTKGVFRSPYPIVDRVFLSGAAKGHRVLCDAHTVDCPSPVSMIFLFGNMISSIERIAVEIGSRYTVACDLLKYVMGSLTEPPLYAAVVVELATKDYWIDKISTLNKLTTFVVLISPNKEPFARIQYSRFNNATLYIYSVPSNFQIEHRLMHGHQKVSIILPSANASMFTELCASCDVCMTKIKRNFVGRLKNSQSGYCLGSSSSNEWLSISACIQNVCVLELALH
jgi:hypothetical protein